MTSFDLPIDSNSQSAWRGRRVAITGATGFVGHHLARLLQELGARVTAITRATSNLARLDALGIEAKPGSLDDPTSLTHCLSGSEIVFHIAGAVDFDNNWEQIRRTNVEGTHNLLRSAREASVQRVVLTSSIVAVGASRRAQALDENSPWNLGSLNIPYVTTKREAEELALSENSRDLEVVVVNPSCVIGPDDYGGSEFGTLCQRFWRKRLPLHFGGGNNFVDVRDVAWGHALAALRGRAGDRYLLGGENRSWPEFFALLEKVADKPIFRLRAPNLFAPLVGWLNTKFASGRGQRPYLSPGQAKLVRYYFYVDSARARQELGWTPRPLETSLHDAYRFWSQPKEIRNAITTPTARAA